MSWEINTNELGRIEKLDCCKDCWMYMQRYGTCRLDNEHCSPFKIACKAFTKLDPMLEKLNEMLKEKKSGTV